MGFYPFMIPTIPFILAIHLLLGGSISRAEEPPIRVLTEAAPVPKNPHPLDQVQQLIREGQLTEAHRLLKTLLAIDPKASEVRRELARLLAEYERLIALDLKNRNLQLEFASALVTASHFKQALEIYDRLLKETPTSIDLYLRKALTLYEAGDLKGAAEAYKKVLDLDPSNVEARLALGVLQQALSGLPTPEVPAEVPPAPSPAPAEPPPMPQPVPQPPQEKPEEEKVAEKALETPEEEKQKRVVSDEVERAGALLRRGQLQLEIIESFTHFSTNQLFINGFSVLPILVVGDVGIERVRRDIFATSIVGRYKMPTGFQVEIRVPYQFTSNQISQATGTQLDTAQPTEEQSSQNGDLGDVEGTLFYQVLEERVARPALHLGVGFKARTGRDLFETEDPAANPPSGTGFNSIRTTLTVIKTADPAVLFGSLSYAYALPRKDVVAHRLNQEPTLIDFSPGDNLSLGLGLAYALNFRLTLSLQYQQSITFPSRIDGKKQPNTFTNAAALRLGGIWRINEKRSIDLSVSPGLTLDAPDVRLELRLPFRF